MLLKTVTGAPVQVVAYVTNPTQAALEIPDPNDIRAGEPSISRRTGAGWRLDSENTGTIELSVPSRVINPSETIVISRPSTDAIPDSESFWLPQGKLPDSEGHYILMYVGGKVEFDITQPTKLLSVDAPLHAEQTEFDLRYQKSFTGNADMTVEAVMDDGWPTIRWYPGQFDPASYNDLLVPGVYRLPAVDGSSPGPIVSLTATADASDLITIDFPERMESITTFG